MMDTDQEELTKEFQEQKLEVSGELSESSSSEKFDENGINEHANPNLRGRRGMKHKQRRGSDEPRRGDRLEDCGASCEDRDSDCGDQCKDEESVIQCESREQYGECGAQCEEQRSEEEHVETESEKHSWESEGEDIEDGDFDIGFDLVRPTDVPKAPENSTQFIIDDHDECRLYMSFEAPHPYWAPHLIKNDDPNGTVMEPIFEDAAYVDINYEYESPHDFDNYAYYDQEFELSYKNNRYEELLRLSSSDLINGLQNLENHLKELNDDLVKEDPDPMLERLQSELLELQEKHSILKEENMNLQTCLRESGIDPDIMMQEEVHAESKEAQDSVMEESAEGDSKRPSPLRSEEASREGVSKTVCADASNKENDCEITLEESMQTHKESRNAKDIESCIPVKVLRDSEYHESCEEKPLNSVPEELSAVTV